MGKFDIKESEIYSSYVVKDFGFYERHIIMKSPIRKKGYEQLDVIDDSLIEDSIINDEDKFNDIPKEEIMLSTDISEIHRLSRLRAKNKVHAMAMLNEWDYMITLTFDPKKINSSNPKEVLKTTLAWLRNQYNKKGIKYLILPEYHKKDKKIHWHGFISDPLNKLTLSNSNKKSKEGYEIYNIDSWSDNKGFNTCAKLGKTFEDRAKVSSYVMKYITKDMERIFNKYYYCSNGLLNEPKTAYMSEIPIHDDWYENDYCFIKDVTK